MSGGSATCRPEPPSGLPVHAVIADPPPECAAGYWAGMSRENVEVDRATFKAWNAGNTDALCDLYSPDIIMRPPEGWPEPGPFIGQEAVMRQFEQLRETWDADAVELIGDFIDVGDRVVVRMVFHGEGRGPDANIEMTNVVTVRRGRIVFIEFFWDHAEALEALGVSE
jgi:ketosteroid isomerase-like protein